MNRNEFADQFKRLAAGFGHKITPERLTALWTKFGEVDAVVVVAAVDELLTGSKFPSRGEIEQAMNEAHRIASAAPLIPSAAMTWDPADDCPPLRARFYTRLVAFLWSGDTWPEWSAVEAWVQRTKFDDPPPDWREFIAACWRQNAPGTKSGNVAPVVSRVMADETAWPKIMAAQKAGQ